MTIPEAYNFLGGIRRIEAEIVLKQLYHDELQSCLLPRAITYDGDKVQTPPEDEMGKITARVVDLEREIQTLKICKAKMIGRVVRAIACLDSDDERIILTTFYVRRLPASEVAEITHYSIRGVYKAKHRAVVHLAEKCAQSSV